MPAASEILQGLADIANSERGAAILWHGLLLALILLLAFGQRPRLHHARVGLTVPLASVSVFAWTYQNPFNGMVFGASAAALAVLGARATSTRRVSLGRWPASIAGISMIAFGWVYPHFVDAARWWSFLYEAPLGLIPCPTLSVVIGLALIGGGLGSFAWSLVLGLFGLFYGVFGAAYLGVNLDWMLCAGSLFLLGQAIVLRRLK